MKNNLKLALFNAIITCLFFMNNTYATDKNTRQLQNDCSIYSATVQSAYINQKDKYPQLPEIGGIYSIPKGKTTILNGEFLVGEKNNDKRFRLEHYAKFQVPSGSTLHLLGNMLVQRDGMLINRGTIILKKDSSLIVPDINVSKHSKKKLQYRIDNRNGTFIIDNGTNMYWKEINQTIDMYKTTIYGGTIDFRELLRNIDDFRGNLFLNLEEVKIILFDSIADIDMNKFINTKIFKNIYLGNNCQIDGKFDLPQQYSSSIKRLANNITRDNVYLSKGTIVRSRNTSGICENTVRNLFGDGGKLITNTNSQYSKEKINYYIKELLEQFNEPEKINIINTDYTDICGMEYYNTRLNKELTSDWSNTIDKNILPLYPDLFNNKNRYNMYFSFEGSKNISFELQSKNSNNNYQIAFYRSLSEYQQLFNEKLSTKNSNIINNFVQKYSGPSPYLNTNENTIYKVSTKNNKQQIVYLRFQKNSENFAVLDKLILGTKKNPVKVMLDYSYENGKPKYAQKLAINRLEARNVNSEIVIKPGQLITVGNTDISNISDNEEYYKNYILPNNVIREESSCDDDLSGINQLSDDLDQNIKTKCEQGKNIIMNEKKIALMVKNKRDIQSNMIKNEYDTQSDSGFTITFDKGTTFNKKCGNTIFQKKSESSSDNE